MAALAGGIALDYLWRLSPFADTSRYVIGSMVVIMPAVLGRFHRADTPFDVRKPASALVTDGPYRFSRNPTYVSLTLVYLGIGMLLNNGWALVLTAPLVVLTDRRVVASEERHLEAKFGDQHLRYKSSVRR